MGRTTSKTDKRPDSTRVQVRHKDHDDTVSPGVVSLGWLRQFGKGKWVEISTPAEETADAGTGQEG